MGALTLAVGPGDVGAPGASWITYNEGTGTVTATRGSSLTALDVALSRTPDPGAGGPLNNFGATVTKVT